MAVCRAQVAKAKRGSVTHFEKIADRLEGRVVQQVEMKRQVTHEFTAAEMEKARAVVRRLRVIDVEAKEIEEGKDADRSPSSPASQYLRQS
jgi:hypothetical protein